MMSSFEPQTFGKYYLVDHIATGGMAEIFKAKTFGHGGFENLLVIKRILPHIGEKQDFVDMFIDEAKVSVALQHPNIVRIYDFGRILDNYFIAMECVEGKDVRQVLRQLARERRYLPFRFAAFIALETCKGLQYAHNKSDIDGNPYEIVHRDISPSNVLVSYEGETKVADFGIAKAESNAYETKDGVLKGKFEYMSPEQAKGEVIDHRSDLFSLGIILYEMSTGRRLFKTESDTETLKKIRDEDVVPPSSVKPDIPPALEAIILKALKRDRDERYGSAEEMAEDLRQYLFPATPDTLRHELSAFMKEVFTDAIAAERTRLTEGSAIAAQLKEQAPEWDAYTSATLSAVTQTAVRYAAPTMLGGGLILGVVLLLAGAGGYYAWSSGVFDPWLNPEAPVARFGSLDVMVVPEARLYLDGEDKGVSTTYTLSALEPGEYTIRLEADGHEPLERSVEVVAGDRAKVVEQLAPKQGTAAPAPAPATDEGTDDDDEQGAPPTGPPQMILTSSPSGAEVFVDGERVGTTPTRWTAEVGDTYRVEMRLDGHETASTGVAAMGEGERKQVRLTLPEASKPGDLTVTLAGGWAHVYVDGVKMKKTAPVRGLPVAPGSHEIRVLNEALGIDHTETIEVSSGASVTVKALPK